MTTNKEWLDYLAQNAPDELAAWFDAEHVEHQERALDGDIEPENADSRERLEADMAEYLEREWYMLAPGLLEKMGGWLDRQAAITERENLASRLDSYELATMIDTTIKERNELEAKLAEMRELLSQAHLDWLDDVGEYEEIIDKLKSDLNTAVCDNNSLRYELECLEENKTKVWCDCDCCKWQEEREKLTAERDELQRHCENQRRELANLNNVVNVRRIVYEDGQVDVFSVRELCRRNDELTAEREHYREKFGKCLDYADAIHALMDDEGVA